MACNSDIFQYTFIFLACNRVHRLSVTDNDETEEIVFKVPTILEVYFSIDQMRTLVSVNGDINTPVISIAIKKYYLFC